MHTGFPLHSPARTRVYKHRCQDETIDEIGAKALRLPSETVVGARSAQCFRLSACLCLSVFVFVLHCLCCVADARVCLPV